MRIRNIISKSAEFLSAILLATMVVSSCQEKTNNETVKEYTIEPVRKEFKFTFRTEAKRSVVNTNAPFWMVQSNYSWILAEVVESDSDGKVVQITVDENESGEQRIGSFDLIATDEVGNELARKKVEVVQNPKSGAIDGTILFEDKVFEDFIISSYDLDEDKALSLEEAENIIQIDIENLGVKSVEGIRYFKNLKDLDVKNNELKQLDVSGLQKLETIDFHKNNVSSFHAENCPKLRSIIGTVNDLSTIDLTGLKESLQYLDLQKNHLSQIDLSGMEILKFAALGENSLTSLKVDGCTALWNLACNSNSLRSLNLSGLSELNFLDCADNLLSAIDLKSCTKLVMLTVSGNTSINDLDLTNCPLNHLNINGTKISELKLKSKSGVLSLKISNTDIPGLDLNGFTDLTKLECSGLQLSALDLKPCSLLTNLVCVNSGLKSLDLSGMTNFVSVNVEDNEIPELDLGDATLLESVNVKGNPGISLILAKKFESDSTLKVFADGDCIRSYR